MWNKLVDAQEHPKKKNLVRRIVVFVVIVAAVCSAVGLILFQESLNFDALRRWFKYFNIRDDGDYGIYSFDSHNSNRYGAAGSGLAVASVGGLIYYQDNGAERFSMQSQLELPQLITRGKYMLAYDVGGTKLLLANTSGSLLELSADKAVLDADLSSSGAFCYSSSSSGYKSVLTVYNSRQELAYRWLSSTTYLPVCAISEKGTMLAAVGLGATGGAYESSVSFFRTDANEIQNTVSLGNELIYDLDFLNNDTVIAVGEHTVQIVKSDGTVVGQYAYEEPYLKTYRLEGDGFLALVVNMYKAGNRNSLITVDDSGEEIASLYLGKEVLDISASGNYLSVLTPDALTIYTSSLHVYAETVDIGSATSVLMREDGSALLIGGGAGKLYLP